MGDIFSIEGEKRLVIFDLGGVIMPIRMELTAEAFRKLGVVDIKAHVTSSHAHDGIFHEYQEGTLSTSDFVELFKRQTAIEASDDEIHLAWNAMLYPPNSARLSIIEEMRKKHRVVILSNTNEMHIAEARRMMAVYGGFERYFDNVYCSNEIHMSKPDRDIFEYVLREEGVGAADSVFFND